MRLAESTVIACGSPDSLVRKAISNSATGHSDLRTFCAMTDGVPMLHCGISTPSEWALIERNRSLVALTEPIISREGSEATGAFSWLLPGIPADGPFAHATEIFAQSGPPEAIEIHSMGSVRDGSIVARLYEGAFMLTVWMGLPERVCAFATGERAVRVADDHPDSASRSMRHWVGSLAVSCQFASGRVATLLASNNNSRWSRRAMGVGPMGCVEVCDERLEWNDRDGKSIERSGIERSGSVLSSSAPPSIASIAAATIAGAGAFERAVGARVAPQCRAFVEAACLSALTGEPESPATVEQLLGRL